MTEIKNSLFRFVTMRAPELADKKSKDVHFVQHPDPASTGFFKSLVQTPIENAGTRRLTWVNLASLFNYLRSADEVKAYVGSVFFDFANWLAKNADAVNKDPQIFNAQTQFPGLINLDNQKKFTLWDNLFYQLITSKSDYVREQVIQALMAAHFLDGGPQQYKERVLATVVIPQAFYGNVALTETNPAEPTVYTQPLKKDLAVAQAKEKVKRYAKLTEDLKKVKQEYDQSNLRNYNEVETRYNRDVKSRLRDLTRTDMDSGETRIIPEPTADFEFNPTGISEYVQRLPAQSLFLASQLDIPQVSTFAEAFEKINEEIEKQSTVIFNSPGFKNKVVNINNILLPVTESDSQPAQQYAFLLQPISLGGSVYKLLGTVNLGYTAKAINVSCSIENVASLTQNQVDFTSYNLGNTLVVELFPNGITLSATQQHATGTIVLDNGYVLKYETVFTLTDGFAGRVFPGIPSGTNPDLFIPSGFGIKRIGIADYRLVEQTTCCYVPGEVSHIENVMAREYKEKSSRRLRRSEETITVERQTEKEDLTDTTSTDRYEMQQQTSEVINKDFSASVNASVHFGNNMIGGTIGTNIAYNTSQQQSNTQALTYAKDVTQRAQERVVQKIREERVLKIIDEFEEQNKHGFDNRKGNQHVSGVYRWVDKIYKNQIFNYGKRLMYEFMIPQPAVFHAEAMKGIVNSPSATILEKPVDPRLRDLRDHRDLNESTAASWAAVYNTEIEAAPAANLRISKAFQMDSAAGEIGAKADKIELPDGYKAVSADVNYMFYYHPNKVETSHVIVTVGDRKTPLLLNYTILNNSYQLFFNTALDKEVAVGIEAADIGAISCTIVLNCVRTDQFYKQWQLNTFNAIVEAYEKKLAAYNDALAALQQDPANKATNPSFYRQLENTVLRKNCITYLVGQNNLGKKFYSGNALSDIQPMATAPMDQYAALVKFIEQAFEWDIMSYTFYPFYWGDKSAWQNMYQAEVDDALFRSFLQSGMARVIVTIRPGFEEAVMHYMATGQVWNGGHVPVIGDDLYLSIVEELKNPTYYVEETWETRVPTTLTVIQAGSIGLAADGLPCCHDDEDTGISQEDTVLTGGDDETGG